MLAQVFVCAKAAVNGAGVGQIGVPEIIARFLPKQWALFENVSPVELRAVTGLHCVHVDGEFFAVIVSECVTGHVSVRDDSHSVKKNSRGEESSDAQIA